jgi:DNA (cytosine-5)-methyltransferase 1
MKIKILNLYACLGGNRAKWDEVANIEVVAVEIDPELARLYQERFPNDKVIIGDAHEYLLNNFKDFDFIWSSPPCPTHSRLRFSQKNTHRYKPAYANMSLYQEIILLDNLFEGKYIVENVIPYYQPLIHGNKRGRHIFWSNFNIPNILSNRKQPKISNNQNEISKLGKFHDYDFRQYKGTQRLDKIARNLVDYEAGKTILEVALDCYKENTNQLNLFI